MGKPTVLIHLSPDSQPSTFDSLVAIDAGVDHVLNHGNVTPQQIEGLVHGAMFTRGVKDLKSTALFFSGSDVQTTQTLVDKAKRVFFGPMRVSLMSDPNGCNTTAAATVSTILKHVELSGKTVTIAGGTGPVGRRIAELIGGLSQTTRSQSTRSKSGAPTKVNIISRSFDKAQSVCAALKKANAGADYFAGQLSRLDQNDCAAYDADVLISAGAAGIKMLDQRWKSLPQQQLVIDLNAAPPAGIEGIKPDDDGKFFDQKTCYGAIGIGKLKMKIHKRALQSLFNSNDQILEVEEIFAIGEDI